MPKCQRCATSATSGGWGRYPRNGRLKALCPNCDEQCQTAQKRTDAAKAAGYPGYSNTPEYKRLQREAEKAREGKTAVPYVTQADRNQRGRMRQAERIAENVRARWAADWLSPFRAALYHADPLHRDEVKAKSREIYWADVHRSRQKTAEYKRANQDRVMRHHAQRAERIAETSDGSLTVPRIRELKRRTARCTYCDTIMFSSDKVTDHMIPLCRGGEHSLRNLVICCRLCNARKASLPYQEWVERIEPEHRGRVGDLYELRYGMPLEAIA